MIIDTTKHYRVDVSKLPPGSYVWITYKGRRFPILKEELYKYTSKGAKVLEQDTKDIDNATSRRNAKYHWRMSNMFNNIYKKNSDLIFAGIFSLLGAGALAYVFSKTKGLRLNTNILAEEAFDMDLLGVMNDWSYGLTKSFTERTATKNISKLPPKLMESAKNQLENFGKIDSSTLLDIAKNNNIDIDVDTINNAIDSIYKFTYKDTLKELIRVNEYYDWSVNISNLSLLDHITTSYAYWFAYKDKFNKVVSNSSYRDFIQLYINRVIKGMSDTPQKKELINYLLKFKNQIQLSSDLYAYGIKYDEKVGKWIFDYKFMDKHFKDLIPFESLKQGYFETIEALWNKIKRKNDPDLVLNFYTVVSHPKVTGYFSKLYSEESKAKVMLWQDESLNLYKKLVSNPNAIENIEKQTMIAVYAKDKEAFNQTLKHYVKRNYNLFEDTSSKLTHQQELNLLIDMNVILYTDTSVLKYSDFTQSTRQLLEKIEPDIIDLYNKAERGEKAANIIDPFDYSTRIIMDKEGFYDYVFKILSPYVDKIKYDTNQVYTVIDTYIKKDPNNHKLLFAKQIIEKKRKLFMDIYNNTPSFNNYEELLSSFKKEKDFVEYINTKKYLNKSMTYHNYYYDFSDNVKHEIKQEGKNKFVIRYIAGDDLQEVRIEKPILDNFYEDLTMFETFVHKAGPHADNTVIQQEISFSNRTGLAFSDIDHIKIDESIYKKYKLKDHTNLFNYVAANLSEQLGLPSNLMYDLHIEPYNIKKVDNYYVVPISLRTIPAKEIIKFDNYKTKSSAATYIIRSVMGEGIANYGENYTKLLKSFQTDKFNNRINQLKTVENVMKEYNEFLFDRIVDYNKDLSVVLELAVQMETSNMSSLSIAVNNYNKMSYTSTKYLNEILENFGMNKRRYLRRDTLIRQLKQKLQKIQSDAIRGKINVDINSIIKQQENLNKLLLISVSENFKLKNIDFIDDFLLHSKIDDLSHFIDLLYNKSNMKHNEIIDYLSNGLLYPRTLWGYLSGIDKVFNKYTLPTIKNNQELFFNTIYNRLYNNYKLFRDVDGKNTQMLKSIWKKYMYKFNNVLNKVPHKFSELSKKHKDFILTIRNNAFSKYYVNILNTSDELSYIERLLLVLKENEHNLLTFDNFKDFINFVNSSSFYPVLGPDKWLTPPKDMLSPLVSDILNKIKQDQSLKSVYDNIKLSKNMINFRLEYEYINRKLLNNGYKNIDAYMEELNNLLNNYLKVNSDKLDVYDIYRKFLYNELGMSLISYNDFKKSTDVLSNILNNFIKKLQENKIKVNRKDFLPTGTLKKYISLINAKTEVDFYKNLFSEKMDFYLTYLKEKPIITSYTSLLNNVDKNITLKNISNSIEDYFSSRNISYILSDKYKNHLDMEISQINNKLKTMQSYLNSSPELKNLYRRIMVEFKDLLHEDITMYKDLKTSMKNVISSNFINYSYKTNLIDKFEKLVKDKSFINNLKNNYSDIYTIYTNSENVNDFVFKLHDYYRKSFIQDLSMYNKDTLESIINGIRIVMKRYEEHDVFKYFVNYDNYLQTIISDLFFDAKKYTEFSEYRRNYIDYIYKFVDAFGKKSKYIPSKDFATFINALLDRNRFLHEINNMKFNKDFNINFVLDFRNMEDSYIQLNPMAKSLFEATSKVERANESARAMNLFSAASDAAKEDYDVQVRDGLKWMDDMIHNTEVGSYGLLTQVPQIDSLSFYVYNLDKLDAVLFPTTTKNSTNTYIFVKHLDELFDHFNVKSILRDPDVIKKIDSYLSTKDFNDLMKHHFYLHGKDVSMRRKIMNNLIKQAGYTNYYDLGITEEEYKNLRKEYARIKRELQNELRHSRFKGELIDKLSAVILLEYNSNFVTSFRAYLQKYMYLNAAEQTLFGGVALNKPELFSKFINKLSNNDKYLVFGVDTAFEGHNGKLSDFANPVFAIPLSYFKNMKSRIQRALHNTYNVNYYAIKVDDNLLRELIADGKYLNISYIKDKDSLKMIPIIQIPRYKDIEFRPVYIDLKNNKLHIGGNKMDLKDIYKSPTIEDLQTKLFSKFDKGIDFMKQDTIIQSQQKKGVQLSENIELKEFEDVYPFKQFKTQHSGVYYKKEGFDSIEQLYKFWAARFLGNDIKIMVLPKVDGLRFTIHKKDNEVKIFTEDRWINRAMFLDKLVEDVKRIKEDFILDGEIFLYDSKGNPVPRYKMMILSKGVRFDLNDVNYIYYAYDLIYFDNKSLVNLPFKDRFNMLREYFSDLKYVKIVPVYIAENEQDLKTYFDKVAVLPYSEGANFITEDSFYASASGKNVKFAKIRMLKAINVKIIAKREKKLPEHYKKDVKLFLYKIAYKEGGKLIPFRTTRIYAINQLQELNEWQWLNPSFIPKQGEHQILSTTGTQVEANVGDNLLIKFSQLRHWKGKDGQYHYSIYMPMVVAKSNTVDDISKYKRYIDEVDNYNLAEPIEEGISIPLAIPEQILYLDNMNDRMMFKMFVAQYLEVGFIIEPFRQGLLLRIDKYGDVIVAKNQDDIEITLPEYIITSLSNIRYDFSIDVLMTMRINNKFLDRDTIFKLQSRMYDSSFIMPNMSFYIYDIIKLNNFDLVDENILNRKKYLDTLKGFLDNNIEILEYKYIKDLKEMMFYIGKLKNNNMQASIKLSNSIYPIDKVYNFWYIIQ